VWVLFADASRIRISDLRADLGRCVRLLGLGLPLTIAFGAVAGYLLLGSVRGTRCCSAPRLLRLTRLWAQPSCRINESAAGPTGPQRGERTQRRDYHPSRDGGPGRHRNEAGLAGHDTPGRAVLGLLLGALIGVGVGAGGGLLLRQTRRRGWSSEEFAGPAVLALSLLAYLSAVLAGANGFVAAFVGGIAFTLCAGRRGEKEVYYVEQTGGLSSMVAWLLFGALAVPTPRRACRGRWSPTPYSA